MKFAKFKKNTFLTEQLQWLLLTLTGAPIIDEYQIQLKKGVCFRENQYLSEGDNSWIFLSFSFSILSDEMVLLCNMFYQDIFIINKESHWL